MTTCTVSETTPLPLSGKVSAIAGSVLVRVWNLLRAIKHRHEASLLANFDDRMLADIGLTRSDIRDAYSVPMWTDPTALLRSRVAERHRFRHGAPFGLGEHSVIAPSLVPDHGHAAGRPARQTT